MLLVVSNKMLKKTNSKNLNYNGAFIGAGFMNMDTPGKVLKSLLKGKYLRSVIPREIYVSLFNETISSTSLKFSFNADTDGLAGIQELAGQATHLFYTTDESKEGRNAFMEKRDPDFSESKWLP